MAEYEAGTIKEVKQSWAADVRSRRWRENEVAGEKEIQFLWRRLKWSEDSSLMWEWSEETGFYSKKLTFFYSYTTLYIHGHGQSYIHFTTLQCTPHCTPQSPLHLAAQGRAPLHTPLHTPLHSLHTPLHLPAHTTAHTTALTAHTTAQCRAPTPHFWKEKKKKKWHD